LFDFPFIVFRWYHHNYSNAIRCAKARQESNLISVGTAQLPYISASCPHRINAPEFIPSHLFYRFIIVFSKGVTEIFTA
jgi:hypothetical protein